MPFGGFDNFDDCVDKMMKQGHDKDSALKICGAIKARTETADLKSLKGIEIFATGEWNGEKYTSADLDQLVLNFAELKNKVEPPLKLGHDDEQKFSGRPAVGWITNIYRHGKKLLADISNIPSKVYDLIIKKAYKKVSSEIFFNFKDGDTGKMFDKVLAGVALLGEEVPAVGTLNDVQALYQLNTVKVFSMEVKGGKITMTTNFSTGIDDTKLKEIWNKACSDQMQAAGYFSRMGVIEAEAFAKAFDSMMKGDELDEAGQRCFEKGILQLQIGEKFEEINSLNSQLAEKQKEIDGLVAQTAVVNNTLEDTKKKVDSMSEDIKVKDNEIAKLKETLSVSETELKSFKLSQIETADNEFVDKMIAEAKIIPAQKEQAMAILKALRISNSVKAIFSVDGKEVSEDLRETVKKFISSMHKHELLNNLSDQGDKDKGMKKEDPKSQTGSPQVFESLNAAAKHLVTNEKIAFGMALKQANKLVALGKFKIADKKDGGE